MGVKFYYKHGEMYRSGAHSYLERLVLNDCYSYGQLRDAGTKYCSFTFVKDTTPELVLDEGSEISKQEATTMLKEVTW